MQERPGGLTYTIIRPGGLKTEPATGNAILTENTKVCGAITRGDAAELIVKALFSDKTDNKVRVFASARMTLFSYNLTGLPRVQQFDWHR